MNSSETPVSFDPCGTEGTSEGCASCPNRSECIPKPEPEVETPDIDPAEPLPNPGTREALASGCRCPVLDNSHGWGYRREGEFIFSEGCDLHASIWVKPKAT